MTEDLVIVMTVTAAATMARFGALIVGVAAAMTAATAAATAALAHTIVHHPRSADEEEEEEEEAAPGQEMQGATGSKYGVAVYSRVLPSSHWTHTLHSGGCQTVLS
jgi:hypothetical protein